MFGSLGMIGVAVSIEQTAINSKTVLDPALPIAATQLMLVLVDVEMRISAVAGPGILV